MSTPTNGEGAAGRPPLPQRRPSRGAAEAASTVRHEEELEVGTSTTEVGTVRARKRVESRQVEEVVPRKTERFADVERAAPNDEDSGKIETLPDGSVSIPVLEEELVVTKRTVVRERIIVRKQVETEQQRIEAELRKERVELDASDAADVREE